MTSVRGSSCRRRDQIWPRAPRPTSSVRIGWFMALPILLPKLWSGPQPRIERVAQTVPELVDRQHGEHDGDAGAGGEPPCDPQILPSVADHRPPFRRGGLRAKPEEAQPSSTQNRRRNIER